MIRKYFSWIALLTTIAMGSVYAQESVVKSIQVQDSAHLENALLWKISRPDIQDTSYLFGTIHLIDVDKYFLPMGTESALGTARRIVFEIDLAEMMDISAQLGLLMKAFMPDGIQLRDLVSEEDYQLVEKHFEDMGLPMFMLDRIKPLFLTVFASADMSPDDLSTGEMTSYEMEFYDYAKDHEIPTGGLETMEFQLSVFDSIPYQAQAEMLVGAIKGMEEQNDAFDEMIQMYLDQDIESLYAEVGADETGAGDYEDILIKDRNERWIGGITDFMEEAPVFFAVGAGHLGGPDGVVRLLRKAGFTVVPVSHMRMEN